MKMSKFNNYTKEDFYNLYEYNFGSEIIKPTNSIISYKTMIERMNEVLHGINGNNHLNNLLSLMNEKYNIIDYKSFINVNDLGIIFSYENGVLRKKEHQIKFTALTEEDGINIYSSRLFWKEKYTEIELEIINNYTNNLQKYFETFYDETSGRISNNLTSRVICPCSGIIYEASGDMNSTHLKKEVANVDRSVMKKSINDNGYVINGVTYDVYTNIFYNLLIENLDDIHSRLAVEIDVLPYNYRRVLKK